ncbi:serine hydrolase domain-containing protein [Ramlibacter pallidus]|uniref:Beta-lactamase family protein n=1 Tax=Ramlibacter pallidus TaxID=2780087 RepID=A0ABR9S1F3_9BURK|nr:serine hydrolase domain-containing protein [Ramlibacter pallidus]MBE7367340.1 beta-lactamase family protein [Ramlibacter pallidus]
MQLLPVLLLAGVLAAPGATQAAPDEAALGKAAGYPVQRSGPGFSMFTDHYKVGTFSQMDQVFWPRVVQAPAEASPLPADPVPLANFRYTFDGASLGIDDFLARQRITGLLVIKDGKVLVERYQYDRTAAHRFASFSVAKTVTALLVGLALQDGHIVSLDDPAARYAPELKDSAWGPVTVRNLLRMSSGVRWNDKVMAGAETDGARLAVESFYQRGRGGASAVAWVRQTEHPQGTRFNYNSAETFVLGVVLRGALRTDLSTYLSEKVWKPMGAEADASWLVDRTGLEAANCCLNATLRDYGRLGMLLANDGLWNGREVLPREFLLDATDPARQPAHLQPRKATPYFGYGYQAWLYPYRTRTFGMRGLFGQELIVQPDSRFVMVITSALQSADQPAHIAVERNTLLGALLTTLGGKADLYR